LTSGALSLGAVTSDGGTKAIAWTYDAAAANLDFLREGQTLTVDYTVKINDGIADSGTQHVIITVTGTNDTPVFSAVTATDPTNIAELTDASSQDLAPIHGTLTVSDKDVGDTLTASVVGSPSVTVSGGGTAPAAVVTALTSGALSLGAVTSDGGTKAIAWTYDAAAANLD